MNFRPELAAKVMSGEKDVTRRLTSSNPRSPWWKGACSLKVNQSYAVCPGRGTHAIGRVNVISVRQERIGWVNDAEAVREGFADAHEFVGAFMAINRGKYDPAALVWRVEFYVIARDRKCRP